MTQVKGTSNIADYYELKLSVLGFTDTDFSHILGVYCYTPGIDKAIEPTPLYKKVNFYKFKAWIIDRDWIVNFEDWKFKYTGSAHYYQCIADFINATENRTKVFIPRTELDIKLDNLLSQAQATTSLMQSMVG